MFDTFIAIIMVCSVQSTMLEPKCVYLTDKTGPAGSLVACRERLDAMWLRIEDNTVFITDTTKKIGEFKLTQGAHKGYCLNPSKDSAEEISKYTF